MFDMWELILINQHSQGLKDTEELCRWFSEKDEEWQKEAVISLLLLVGQSHPQKEELLVAIDVSPVKKTSTAVVMLTNPRKDYLKYGYELKKLSGKELKNAWVILLNLLKIADTRRRESEDPATCNHWWHKDLSNPKYIKRLLKGLE